METGYRTRLTDISFDLNFTLRNIILFCLKAPLIHCHYYLIPLD